MEGKLLHRALGGGTFLGIDFAITVAVEASEQGLLGCGSFGGVELAITVFVKALADFFPLFGREPRGLSIAHGDEGEGEDENCFFHICDLGLAPPSAGGCMQYNRKMSQS